ncbi:MAG: NHLP bacteriocin export ABC transporter permease/ATPase subunit [Magnetococcales bacterium]|nr:NHLP bacteriocin export ABC transporter permease/ATPase subunit [Magnetococcales bacterium]
MNPEAESGQEAGVSLLPSQQYLLLDEAACCHRVLEGALAIYRVRVENGLPVGARRHLFTCLEGKVLHGVALEHEGARHVLMAVATEACRLLRIELPAADAPVVTVEEGLLDGFQGFASLLADRLLEGVETPYAEKVEVAVPFQFAEGQCFRSAGHGFSLLRLDSGVVRPLDLEPLDRSEPLATTGSLWFRAMTPVKGMFHPFTEETVDLFALSSGVAALGQAFLRHSLQLEAQSRTVERQRFAQLEALGREEERRTVALLRPGQRHDPRLFVPRETPLLGAMGVIGGYLGLRMVAEPEALTRHSGRDEQVGVVCHASGTRFRRVRLLGTWWRDDVGQLLAFRKANGAPVALINEGYFLGLARRYEVVDGESGQRQPLTPEMAEEFDEVAYAFLRPLPLTGKLSFAQLSRFTYLPFLGEVRLMLLLSLVSGLLGIFMPVANFMMTDRVIPDANRELMTDLAVGLMAMSMGIFLFGLSSGLVSIRFKSQLTAHLQVAVMDRLLRLPLRFFRRFPSGDLLNRAMMISEISAGFSMNTFGAVLGLLSTLIMLGVCFYYSAKLAFLALVAALVTSVFSLSFSFIIRKKALNVELKSGEEFGFVVQMVNGVSKLQIARAEGRALNQWAARFGEQMKEEQAIDELEHWSGLINLVIQSGSTIALYYLAGGMVAETAALQAINPLTPPLLTIGTFFAVQGAFGSVVGGIVSFFATFINIHQLYAKQELVRPILDEPVEGGTCKTDPGRLDGQLQLARVTFRYSGDGPRVLHEVSLKVQPGEFMALVGPSGSGKSTILKLLLGFEFPESGQILFDKKDISDLDMLLVRRQVGVVLQDGRINAGTIYHAISGASSLSMDEAWEAAEAAGFAEDIKAFPMGMHTLLSEGATTLSGGQRQRLLIARALATKPRIVFFDEATSALDNRTQAIVTESLRQRKITRVVVAHRLTTIMDADRIYVLDKGEVVEEGNFEELMARKGLFQRMASRQLA